MPIRNHFTRQGTLVNRLLRWRYPGYRALAGRTVVAQLLRTTWQQERFHWAALVSGAAGRLRGWA